MTNFNEQTNIIPAPSRNFSMISMYLLAGLLVMVNPTSAKADEYYSDGDGLSMILNIASSFLIEDSRQRYSDDHRDQRRESRNNRSRNQGGYSDNRNRGNGYSGNRTSNRNYGERSSNRQGRHGVINNRNSFTTQPVRGGSSRRTRIIENPFPDRRVVGVTLTGIDNDVVHVEDVVAYPQRRRISHRGYTLSLYHPERHINTRGFMDYISVKAKRKEYFTVTFHYG